MFAISNQVNAFNAWATLEAGIAMSVCLDIMETHCLDSAKVTATILHQFRF